MDGMTVEKLGAYLLEKVKTSGNSRGQGCRMLSVLNRRIPNSVFDGVKGRGLIALILD